jgi:glutaredoxin 2
MKLFLYNHCVPICVQVHFVFHLILNELENISHGEISHLIMNKVQLLWTREFTND